MALEVTVIAGPTIYTSPFLFAEAPDHLKLDVSTLTTAEVDAKGYVKPGVFLKQDGTLCNGTAGEIVYGAVREGYKLPGRSDNANLGSDTSDPLIAVMTLAHINRDIWEDNMGRAISVNELAALKGSGIKVTST